MTSTRACQSCGGEFFTWPGAYENPVLCDDCSFSAEEEINDDQEPVAVHG